MNQIFYTNPLSDQQTINNFKFLSGDKQCLTILISALATIATLGALGGLTFRVLTNKFSAKPESDQDMQMTNIRAVAADILLDPNGPDLLLAREKGEAAHILARFKVALDRAAEAVQDPGSLRGIQMTPQLSSFNLSLRKLEAKMIALETFRDDLIKAKTGGAQQALEEVRSEQTRIREEYNKLQVMKVMHVKQNYASKDRVYAMAIPQVLPKGLIVCTAGTPAKMTKILKNEGFEWPENAPATCFGHAAEVGQFGDNEMGDKGRYFSIGLPAYLGDAYPEFLECELTADMHGISIMYVTELRAQFNKAQPIVEGFTPEEIEAGYRRLQKNYPFLQADGLPPKDSEVVFMRTEQKLLPKEIKVEDPNIDHLFSSKQQITDAYPLHPSWHAPAQLVEESVSMRTGQIPNKQQAAKPVPTIQVRE